MRINNDTTTHQIAEMMGPDADEIDGRIMMSLISRDCIVDTDEISETQFGLMIDEVCMIRRDLPISRTTPHGRGHNNATRSKK